MDINSFLRKISHIQGLTGGMCNNLMWQETKKQLHDLINENIGHILLKYSLIKQSKVDLYRGRIENISEINNTKELIYRHENDVTYYGRCNKPNQSIFYASNNLDTVLSELPTEINDTLYILKTSIKNESKLDFIPIGELDHLRRYGKSLLNDSPEVIKKYQKMMDEIREGNNYEFYIQHTVDAYLSELFLEKANEQKEYKMTSALSDSIDGMSYPSVKHRGGINFALKANSFDEKIEIESCAKIKIVSYLGFGIYTYETLGVSKKIEKDGTINW